MHHVCPLKTTDAPVCPLKTTDAPVCPLKTSDASLNAMLTGDGEPGDAVTKEEILDMVFTNNEVFQRPR